MKRLLGLALAVLVMAMAVPAFADVDVNVEIKKDKQIWVWERVLKIKIPIAIVVLIERLDGAAEAAAVVNVTNWWNIVDTSQDKIDLKAVITGSIEYNTGIVQVNQDVGNMVNQGNVVAVAVTSEKSWTDAQAEVDQKNIHNTVNVKGSAPTPDRTATISGSINNNTGIVQVNQNASYMNNQTNAAAVGVGFGAAVALSEAALGQVNASNEVREINTLKVDLIDKSINHNTGIVSVNQSTGNMNNQGAAVSVAGLAARARLGD